MYNFIMALVISKIAKSEIMKTYHARIGCQREIRNNTSNIFEIQTKQQLNRTSRSVRFQFSFFRVVYHRNDVALTQFLSIAGISRVASLDDSMKTSLGRYRDAESKDKREV